MRIAFVGTYISLMDLFCLFHSASFVSSGVAGRSNSKMSLTSADMVRVCDYVNKTMNSTANFCLSLCDAALNRFLIR